MRALLNSEEGAMSGSGDTQSELPGPSCGARGKSAAAGEEDEEEEDEEEEGNKVLGSSATASSFCRSLFSQCWEAEKVTVRT